MFQKKSTRGIKTPQREIETIKRRLKEAEEADQQRSAGGRERAMSEQVSVIRSSGNVFADIGSLEPEVALAKADLILAISAIIADRGWTQAEAASALGIDQPKISALLRGQLAGFSFERLMRFLNRLNFDVTLAVTQSHSDAPRTSVTFRGVGEDTTHQGDAPLTGVR
jgi:predicted XRE-type DNA-binding protein